jgi:hypothetical protein
LSALKLPISIQGLVPGMRPCSDSSLAGSGKEQTVFARYRYIVVWRYEPAGLLPVVGCGWLAPSSGKNVHVFGCSNIEFNLESLHKN